VNSTVTKRAVRGGERVLTAGIALAVVTAAALAGADTTFDTTVNQITDWSEGSLGKLAAVGGVAVALVGMILKFDWRLIAGAVGIGLTAATGPGIVTSLATATF